jgi:hypothetical protein
VGLALVVVASAARPLAEGVPEDQAVLALAIVALAAAVPPGFVRLWERRRAVAVALLVLALLALLWVVVPLSPSRLLPERTDGRREVQVPVTTGGHARAPRRDDGGSLHWVVSPWVAAALSLALAVVVAAAVAMLWRRARQETAFPPAPPPVAEEPELTLEQLYSLLDDTLEDLHAEPDPRAAIIAAYFRMERGLAAFGIARRRSEAPLEYLERALGRLSVSAPAARRLTDLFERGKFGPAPVDDGMKAEAIAALETIRDEVGAWAAAR